MMLSMRACRPCIEAYVYMHIVEEAVTQLTETIRDLTNKVSLLEDTVFNDIAGITERVNRLENIYVIIDFLKIENVCDNIFSDRMQQCVRLQDQAQDFSPEQADTDGDKHMGGKTAMQIDSETSYMVFDMLDGMAFFFERARVRLHPYKHFNILKHRMCQ